MAQLKSIVIALLLYVLFLNQVLSLDVVANKTGEEQVKEALNKAEKESAQAAKNKNVKNDNSNDTKKDQKDEKLGKHAMLLKNSSAVTSDDSNTQSKIKEDLNKIIAQKVAELQKLREKSKKLSGDNNEEIEHKSIKKEKDSAKLERVSADVNTVSNLLKSAENKEKENSKLEEASDKKMVDMARKLNKLVLKFQRRMGHLNHQHSSKTIDDSLDRKDSSNDESTVKDVRGKTATRHPSPASIDLTALHADDSNAKTSYKEDVKLEDRLALEAEEEKKVTNGDTYDDDSTAEAAAGVDKSTTATAASSSSLSPKEQASQEMQSYNALISSESNRELSQIQDEISKATQSSMGKVSVEGQTENVQTEAPGFPGLGEDAGLAAALNGAGGAGGFEGLGGSNDPILQGLQGGTDAGLLAAAASNSDVSAQQTSAMQGMGLGGAEQKVGDPSGASVNAGGSKPIEIGSSTPVDMGMFNGAASIQKGLQGPEPGDQPIDIQSNFMNQSPSSMDQQGFGQQPHGMSFKKSKILKQQKKVKKSKKFKRTIKKPSRRQH